MPGRRPIHLGRGAGGDMSFLPRILQDSAVMNRRGGAKSQLYTRVKEMSETIKNFRRAEIY